MFRSCTARERRRWEGQASLRSCGGVRPLRGGNLLLLRIFRARNVVSRNLSLVLFPFLPDGFQDEVEKRKRSVFRIPAPA